jgi:O-antigen ligase
MFPEAILFWKPVRNKGYHFATPWSPCTILSVSLWEIAAPLIAAMAATLTIWVRDPLAEWSYELAVFGIAIAVCVRRGRLQLNATSLALGAIGLWGFIELALGASVYRYATLNAGLRFAALAATAYIAPSGRSRGVFLRVFVWFAFGLSVLSVLAYYSSRGKVLWIFASEYPDVWGPFPNRNNFAAFLELAMPVALWLAITRDRVYVWIAAAMLAAGIASASRAGAVLLTVESLAVFALAPGSRRMLARFAAAAVVLAAIAGAGQLAGRIFEPDPLRYRREMAHSALAMIRDRPFSGFGLGTFATVYPQYAEFDAGATVNHAHNDWLEWASEGGVGFAAAWGVLAAAMLRRVRGSIWTIGVPTVMIHALVDYPFARFGVSAWTFLLIGMRELDPGGH